MTRTAQQAAIACASLWTAHRVECAKFARTTLTGPPTTEGEPAPADEVETKLLYEFAFSLTTELHARALRLGLEDIEVEAGRQVIEASAWHLVRNDYQAALRFIGGRLS